MSRDVTIVLRATDEYSSTLQKFNTEVGKISGTTNELTGNSTRAGGALDSVAAGITGAVVAYAGWKGIQLVGDMIDLGQQASITSQTFDALTSKIGGAGVNMSALKTATGGTVDNITLLTGANKLLQMGLATNTDELAKLSGMAIKLGSSMGMDATKAMSDFSLMLANNSIMRLDQFGISSGRVRTRMESLKQTMEGIDKSEAFKLAVLEEGQSALERLGEAATAAETPINRLKTNVQNLGQSFSEDFSVGANSVLGILELVTGNNPVQKQQQADKQKAENDAAAIATAYAQRYHEALGSQFQALGTADLLFKQSLALAQQNPTMSSNDAVTQAYSQLTYNDTVGASDEELSKMQQITFAMLEQQKAAEATAQAQQDIITAAKERKRLLDDYLASGGGDDRPHGAVDIGLGDTYSALTGSDLAKTKGDNGSNLKPDEITSQMAKDIQSINKDSSQAGQHIEQMERALTKGAGSADRIKIALDNLKSSQNITIKWSSDDPFGIVPIIKAVLGGGAELAAAMAAATRDNGGVPPGVKHAAGGGV